MSNIGAFLTKSQKFGPRSKNLKDAPILLIFGAIKSFHELFSHTKYEHNRSIFDNVQKGIGGYHSVGLFERQKLMVWNRKLKSTFLASFRPALSAHERIWSYGQRDTLLRLSAK